MLLNCDTYDILSHNFNFKLETLRESAPIYRTFKLSIWTLYQLWQYPCAEMILFTNISMNMVRVKFAEIHIRRVRFPQLELLDAE